MICPSRCSVPSLHHSSIYSEVLLCEGRLQGFFSIQSCLLLCYSFRMKSKQVSLNEMPSKSPTHTVRVTIIKKHPTLSRPGKTKFQRLTLKDEEGTTMRACIFGLDVDIYNNIINENKYYDITNVAIKDVDQTYSLYPNEKQMYLTNATSVKVVDDSNIHTQFLPKYIEIASIPQDSQPNSPFDVVAVVLKVGICEKVRTRYGTDVDICRMHITDNSYDDVVILSIWNAKAIDCHQMFQKKSLPIIAGFTGLKVTNFNGFSLSSTAETEIILDPNVEKTTQLTEWCLQNFDKMEEKKCQLMKEEPTSSNVSTLTIKEALQLKAGLVLVGEMIKISTYIHPLSLQDIRTSLGCIHCGRTCGDATNNKIDCTTCMKSTVAIAKIYMDFKTTDGTTTIQLMVHTKLAEKILGVDANTIHQMTLELSKTALSLLSSN